jgi:hypothetical protein
MPSPKATFAALLALLAGCDGGGAQAPVPPPVSVPSQSAWNLLADVRTLFADRVAFQASESDPPYMFVIEAGRAADAAHARVLASLRETAAIFASRFADCGARPPAGPLPVLCFLTRDRFAEYAARRGAALEPDVLGFYEWDGGRLVLHDACDEATRRHEAVHQLAFDLATKPRPFVPAEYFPRQSFGFHEGLAEWTAGLRPAPGTVSVGPDADDVGRFDPARLNDALNAVPRSRRYDVGGLLDLRYAGRALLEPPVRALVYEQGRLLFEFCRNYVADNEGRVLFGRRGTYARGFASYCCGEFVGRSGKRAFAEALGLDEAGLVRLDLEFAAWTDWVLRKVEIGHVVDGRLVPWDAVGSDPRRRAARPEDDLLRPPKNDGK